MERRNSFLTFLCALIPGVGYMYLGLSNMGIETFLAYFLIKPIFGLVGLSFIGSIFRAVIWFYAFFDTFNLARKLDRGEKVFDKGFILRKFSDNYEQTSYNENGYDNENGTDKVESKFLNFGQKNMKIIAWILIVFGVLIIIDKVFKGSDFYYIIKSSINAYFLPCLFIIVGVYLLIKHKF